MFPVEECCSSYQHCYVHKVIEPCIVLQSEAAVKTAGSRNEGQRTKNSSIYQDAVSSNDRMLAGSRPAVVHGGWYCSQAEVYRRIHSVDCCTPKAQTPRHSLTPSKAPDEVPVFCRFQSMANLSFDPSTRRDDRMTNSGRRSYYGRQKQAKRGQERA